MMNACLIHARMTAHCSLPTPRWDPTMPPVTIYGIGAPEECRCEALFAALWENCYDDRSRPDVGQDPQNSRDRGAQ
jgi:hypothetical protein